MQRAAQAAPAYAASCAALLGFLSFLSFRPSSPPPPLLESPSSQAALAASPTSLLPQWGPTVVTLCVLPCLLTCPLDLYLSVRAVLSVPVHTAPLSLSACDALIPALFMSPCGKLICCIVSACRLSCAACCTGACVLLPAAGTPVRAHNHPHASARVTPDTTHRRCEPCANAHASDTVYAATADLPASACATRMSGCIPCSTHGAFPQPPREGAQDPSLW